MDTWSWASVLWLSIMTMIHLSFSSTNNEYSPIYDSRTEFYSHWMSIMSLFSSDEYFGFNIYDKKLSELTLAGSHHSGMYESAIRKQLKPSSDQYYSAIKYLNNTDKFVKWSIRQKNSIYDQLLAGKNYIKQINFMVSCFYDQHLISSVICFLIIIDRIQINSF